ncbi:MAG: signal peptidase II [Patescibacteria group bacterium]
MNIKKVRWIIIFISGFFLFLDQTLKWLALHSWSQPHIFNNFGWQPFFNKGIAFSLPISNTLTIILTVPMIFLIGILCYREYNRNKMIPMLGWSLILAGALSNLLDRIFYRSVIDYILIWTGIINISDLLIIIGLIIFLINLRNKN